MKLLQKVKERVKMFKRKPNDNINIIYRAPEETRRAIDDLYVRKSDRTKMVVALAALSLFVGLGLGWYGTVSNTISSKSSTTVTIELAEQLKAQPQSVNK